jgi:hypothetical protein
MPRCRNGGATVWKSWKILEREKEREREIERERKRERR